MKTAGYQTPASFFFLLNFSSLSENAASPNMVQAGKTQATSQSSVSKPQAPAGNLPPHPPPFVSSHLLKASGLGPAWQRRVQARAGGRGRATRGQAALPGTAGNFPPPPRETMPGGRPTGGPGASPGGRAEPPPPPRPPRVGAPQSGPREPAARALPRPGRPAGRRSPQSAPRLWARGAGQGRADDPGRPATHRDRAGRWALFHGSRAPQPSAGRGRPWGRRAGGGRERRRRRGAGAERGAGRGGRPCAEGRRPRRRGRLGRSRSAAAAGAGCRKSQHFDRKSES